MITQDSSHQFHRYAHVTSLTGQKLKRMSHKASKDSLKASRHNQNLKEKNNHKMKIDDTIAVFIMTTKREPLAKLFLLSQGKRS